MVRGRKAGGVWGEHTLGTKAYCCAEGDGEEDGCRGVVEDEGGEGEVGDVSCHGGWCEPVRQSLEGCVVFGVSRDEGVGYSSLILGWCME